MADKRITDLPELIQADSGDFIPIVDSSMNVTKRVAAEKVLPNSSVELSRLKAGAAAGTLVTNSSGDVSVRPSAVSTITASGNIGGTWYKRTPGDGVTEYVLTTSSSWSTGGSSWAADRTLTLPESHVWNASKMSLQVSAVAADPSLQLSAGLDTSTRLKVNRYNPYATSVNTSVTVHVVFRVYDY